MKSNWEFSKSRSSYHFNNTIKDEPGKWFQVLGKFNNNWQHELEYINTCNRPITWRNRKSSFKDPRPTSVSPHIDAEEYDIVQGGGNPAMEMVNIFDDFDKTPNIQKLTKFFELEQEKSRVHTQYTGQVWNIHIDKIDIVYLDIDPKDLAVFIVMLEDWQPGQFYLYGTHNYSHWQAGDVISFDWYNTPHATANASYHPRNSIYIMGVKTEKTNLILNDFNKYKGML